MVKAAVVHKASINVLGVSARTGHIVTASADKTVKCFDIRGGSGKNLSRVKLMKTTDSVICGEILDRGNLGVFGCADGNLVSFDLAKGGESLYGFGTEGLGAVNCMAVTPDG